jgi:chromosome segregation ATPase
MTDKEKKIEMMSQRIEEKSLERDKLKDQFEHIHAEVKDLEADIAAFQREMAKLKGEKIVPQTMLRGAEIGEAAIQALKSLGGKAHYFEVKEEIEKHHTISGVNDQSRADSVWHQLNKSDLVDKVGWGVFELKKVFIGIEPTF